MCTMAESAQNGFAAAAFILCFMLGWAAILWAVGR